MKKFSIILESFVSDQRVIDSMGYLGNYLIYNLGMRDIVMKYLEPYSKFYDFNDACQYPLELLYKTGKFSDIKLLGNKYYTKNLIIEQVRVNNKWHPVNKLNTNSLDQAVVLFDLFKILGVLDEVKQNLYPQTKLKNWLSKFFKENDVLGLIIENGIKLSQYTTYNRKFSEIGEKAESDVASHLQSKGYTVLYQGGDGDPIDMKYGIDLIVSKDDKILLIQVKSKEKNAIKASNSSQYRFIDLFYWSDNGSVGSVGDQTSLF